jgi:hypothetical protein
MLFKLTLLSVGGLLICVGGVAANHLIILGDSDALALNDLNVVQAAKDLVLDFELGAHGELGTLLDLEGLVLEGRLASRLGEIDGDGRTASRLHGEGEDDADSGVVGVGDGGAAAEAQRLLVPLERLVASIYAPVSKSLEAIVTVVHRTSPILATSRQG